MKFLSRGGQVMQKRNKPIDSETLKKLEQEIYDNVMNYSNKNEVF